MTAFVLQLSPGDILQFPRTGYNHYGIHVGEGQVIHRIIRHINDTKANVIQSPFWHLMDSSGIAVCNFLDRTHRPYPPEQIVKRARAKLGCRGFDLLDNNCEHFVTWCRYGQEASPERDRIVLGAVKTVVLLTAMMMAVATGSLLGFAAFVFFVGLQILVVFHTFPQLWFVVKFCAFNDWFRALVRQCHGEESIRD